MTYQRKLIKALILGILFLICAAPLKAQFEERVPIKKIAKPYKPSTFRPTVKRPPVQKIQKVINTVVVERIAKTSNLSVYTEPGATVRLEPQNPRQKKINLGKTADKEGSAVFENLTPAKYKITAEKDGFESQEQDVVEIQAQKTQSLVMDLKPITYDLTIETNINDGEVRYAPAEYRGIGQDGSLITRDKENNAYCIVPIKNKIAVIKGLKRDYYNIDILPGSGDIQYNRIKTAIDISKEASSDLSDSEDRSLSFEISLDKKLSEVTFDAAAWTNDDWIKPAGWKLNKLLKTDGLDGIALPRNDSYRYYTDFEMIGDVRLLNANTVGFVVRAEDEKNYYLIQISGAKAEERHVIKGYIVKNDKREQFFSLPITNFAKTLAAQNFRVIINGKGNVFRVFIEDIANGGSPLPVGDFPDQYNNFPKGAIGIAGNKNSNFEVGGFMICARKCNY